MGRPFRASPAVRDLLFVATLKRDNNYFGRCNFREINLS
jgi:hypothetical protein